MNGILTIARLTWIEARRRRIVLAALLCGVAFIAVFSTALYFAPDRGLNDPGSLRMRIQFQAMALAGLYAVNFLAVAFSVMLPVDSLSGEISSGVIQTIAAKPVRRSDILLGKWIVYWLMLAGYILFMVAGIVGVMWFFVGFVQKNLFPALCLMQLEVSVLLSIVIAGGVRFSTVTNGIVAFAFYAIAFVGGWIEQIGVMLCRLAMHKLTPAVMNQVQVSPFGSASVPSMAMVWWSIAYVVVVMLLATRAFQRRGL